MNLVIFFVKKRQIIKFSEKQIVKLKQSEIWNNEIYASTFNIKVWKYLIAVLDILSVKDWWWNRLQVVLCQIIIFCHQLTKNTRYDFVRSDKTSRHILGYFLIEFVDLTKNYLCKYNFTKQNESTLDQVSIVTKKIK